jgi:hypothetical protein
MNRKAVAIELAEVARDLAVASSSRKAEAKFVYATLVFGNYGISFRMSGSGKKDFTGTQPFGNNAPKAIRYVLDLIRKAGIPDADVEVMD